eukprot:SAG31_NODE_6880_length_1862_cov_1.509926_1_plen_136_part_10
MAEQAQETHARELQRQREHEQRQAKIRRTERWVDDCCAPAYQALVVYFRSRLRFVGALATKLEQIHPETFAELYRRGGYSMRGYELAENNVVTWGSTVVFDPSVPKGNTWTAPNDSVHFSIALSSAAAFDVNAQDM